MNVQELKDFLDLKADLYNQPGFIANDPVCIPHQFTAKQDIEIAGFFAAILAWGQRKTIINKCNELLARMDYAPYAFVQGHQDQDLKRLLGFKHRTFNDTDLLYFVTFFKQHYLRSATLETAFLQQQPVNPAYFDALDEARVFQSSAPCMLGEATPFNVETALNTFRSYFFSLEDFPLRTRKHISSPLHKSTCKRLNMFLRWMVRKDTRGVDFGIWSTIKPADLICPCDVHVDRVARRLGLISRPQTDWLTALELTQNLRSFDATDPVKYDFALFGMGVEGNL